MHRTIQMNVTNEEVKMDYPVSKEKGQFTKIIWNDSMARGTFDRVGGRFDIAITDITEFYGKPYYLVSIPDSKFVYETHNPRNIAYKFREVTHFPLIDSESVEMAVRKMMNLIEEAKEYQDTDVRINLVNANYHLGKAVELLVEANKEGQMDYTTNPAESSVFDSVQVKAKQIDKIMYQKG